MIEEHDPTHCPWCGKTDRLMFTVLKERKIEQLNTLMCGHCLRAFAYPELDVITDVEVRKQKLVDTRTVFSNIAVFILTLLDKPQLTEEDTARLIARFKTAKYYMDDLIKNLQHE